MQSVPPPTGERWNVNMPAVIGLVFVFLIGVVIWVVSTSGGDDSEGRASGTTATTAGSSPSSVTAAGTPSTSLSTPVTTATQTTTPTPLPATTVPVTSAAPPTTVPPTNAPVTTAPGADPDAVAGDLAVPGRPMQKPPCDGSYITVLASPIGDQATAGGVASVLEQYPGSNYLRTDQTCSSLTPDVGGEPIYVIFYGPFAFDVDACTARVDGPEGAYARQLSNDVGPEHSISCV